jgi:hypothetical protein
MDSVKRSGEWSLIAAQLSEIKKKLDSLEEIEKDLTNKLIELSDGVSSFDDSGTHFVTYEKKGSIQYNKIPVLQGLSLEEFRKHSSLCWRLETKEFRELRKERGLSLSSKWKKVYGKGD